MAFQDYEGSQNKGQPVELYLFRYGEAASQYYAYTNSTREVVLDAGTASEVVYKPIAVTRGAISVEGNPTDTTLTIEVARSSEIAELFRVYPPPRVVTLVIRNGHIPNEDDSAEFLAGAQFQVIWSGRIKQDGRPGANVTLSCEQSGTALKRPGLRIHYQWPCPAALYGSRCKADKGAATTVATVQSYSSNRITPLGVWIPWPRSIEDYIGGLLEWEGAYGTDYRTIMNFDGSELILNAPLRDITNGQTIKLILGCTHTLEGCGRLHSNFQNYAGQPFIPKNNPTGKNNHY